MFCPNCGAKAEIEQVFCRVCGMEVIEVSQNLMKHAVDSNEKTDWLKRTGVFSLGLVCGAIVTFLLILLMAIFRVREIPSLVLFIILLNISWGFILVLLAEKYQLKKKHTKSKKSDKIADIPPQIEIWKTNRQLNESTFVPVSSVTENTTELFYAESIKPKTSGELG